MRTAALTMAVRLMTLSGAAVVAAQTPLGKEAADLDAHTASALETVRAPYQAWNGHDPRVFGANGGNVAVVYSRRDRGGEVLSKYEVVILVVRRDDVWKVQAVSTQGA